MTEEIFNNGFRRITKKTNKRGKQLIIQSADVNGNKYGWKKMIVLSDDDIKAIIERV